MNSRQILLLYIFTWISCATGQTTSNDNIGQENRGAQDDDPPVRMKNLTPQTLEPTEADDPLYMKHAIPGQYIVIFHDYVVDIGDKALQLDALYQGIDGAENILWVYDSVIRGVTLQGVDDNMLRVLKADPDVKYVEQDVGVFLDMSELFEQQNPPSWGIDRISAPMDGNYITEYTGDGVIVYVVDSGVRMDHGDFVGMYGYSRVSCGSDSSHEDMIASYGRDKCHDEVGHGTYVAGIIGGLVFGVAKKTRLINVKVFRDDGVGSVGSVLHGLDFIHEAKKILPDVPMVANMSFGTPVKLISFHHAIEALFEKNVIMVASAGNEWDNACNKAPGSYREVITAAATDSDDACTAYTNVGTCVNLFAPGSSVSSTYNRDKWDQATFSGTSASSAHVAGVVALLLEKDPNMTHDQIMEALLDAGEKDVVQNIPEETNTPNVLLNMVGLSSM